jgi:hypothetical protein
MSIFSRKPTTLENLRAARENLEHVRARAPSERLMSVQRCGVHPDHGFHPDHDHAEVLIAEAELRVAEVEATYASDEPEGVQLGKSFDAALVATRDALAAIKDDPEPTLASTPEAKAEFENNCGNHAEALKANRSSRLSIIGGAATRIAKAAVASPRMLDEIGSIVDDAKAKLAEVIDPEAPVLGAVSPVTVAALSRALAAHRVHFESNAKKREAICQDLIPVLRAISAGHQSLAKKRREANLPSPQLLKDDFVAGRRLTLETLAGEAESGELTPERCDVYRGAIGCRAANVAGPKAKLAEIADRRKAYENRQAAAAKERERNQRLNFGHEA